MCAVLVAVLLCCTLHGALGVFMLDPSALFPQPQSRTSCRPIPPSLRLCRGIEYERMRLPNLLGHETLSEVTQQAAAWVPLVQKRCHADTRRFLCALFAPVCLEDVHEPIRPCRALCEGVKSACAPVMAAFGFPWPDMLECARFPQEPELCIPPAASEHEHEHEHESNSTGTEPESNGVMKVCDACRVKPEDENEIVDSLCRNDFALKMRVKEILYIDGNTKIIPEAKSRIIYKPNDVTERDLRRTPLWIRDSPDCMCEEMSDISTSYLVMGQKQDGELVITSLKRWQKDQDFKRFARSIRKLQC
ncbi:secreted frizzled-related protein 2 [Trichomycterus rosablanca]|uniref:secreted frizzled-related protein 2 n=1 Tax=Trichomycterus rosablanca TaxID=2290929 RepID=UPI002F35EF76